MAIIGSAKRITFKIGLNCIGDEQHCPGRLGRRSVLAACVSLAVRMVVATGLKPTTGRAQDTDSRDSQLVFDVASVRLIKVNNGPRNVFSYTGDGVNIRGCTLAFIIAETYNFPVGRLQGPESLTKESLWGPLRQPYDITAKVDHGVPQEQIRLMLKSLLRDRFGLIIHCENRSAAVYGLTVAKGGSKLERSAGVEFSFSTGPDGFKFRNCNMVRLISFLAARLDRPVVDHTSLAGAYNFIVKNSDAPPADAPVKSEGLSPDSPSAAAFDESLKKLGLRLVKAREPIEYLVVDQVMPATDN